MEAETKISLERASRTANNLLEYLKPFCERIEIAGSIRRGKAEVSDIEIVAIPKWEMVDDPEDMFAERKIEVNRLFEHLMQSDIHWIYKRNGEVFSATPKPDAKMMKGVLPCGAQLDLFLACPENFGVIKMIRTGSADFSHAMVTRGLQIGKPFRNGFMQTRGGDDIFTFEEEEVFSKLGIEYIEPQRRNSVADMKIVGFKV